MYAGLLGAIGGVIGKGFYAWFINTVVFSLFKKKEMKQAKRKEPKVKGWFALGLAGLGFALILYNFMSGNASIENSAIGVTALMASYRTLKKKNGFLVGFICSFTKGRMTQNSAGVVIKGMILGFGFGVLSSLRFTGSWCYVAGAIILVLAFVMRLSKKKVAVTSVLLMFLVGLMILVVILISFPTGSIWAQTPEDVEPQIVTLIWAVPNTCWDEVNGEQVGGSTLEIWNVGSEGGDAYAPAIWGGYGCQENDEKREIGTFSGGPNGVLTMENTPNVGDTMVFQLIDGKTMDCGLDGLTIYIVQNPEAFDAWRTESKPASGVWELKEILTYILVPDINSLVSSTELFTDQWYENDGMDKKNISVTGNEITLVSTRAYTTTSSYDSYWAHEIMVSYGQPPSRLKAFDAINLSVNEINTFYDSGTDQTTTQPSYASVGFLPGRRNDTFSTILSADDTMAYPFGANLGQTWFERSGDFLSSTVPPGKVGGEIMTLEMTIIGNEPYDSTSHYVWEIPVIAYVYEWQAGSFLPPEDEEDEGIVDDYSEDHASEEETGVISAATAAFAVLVAGAAAAGATTTGIAGGSGGSGNSGYIKKDEDGDYIVNDPVTGEKRVYVKNQRTGRYTNPLSGAEYTEDELNNQVASRAENASVLRQDHEQSEQAKAEQRKANQKLSQAQDEMRKENQMRNVQRDLEQKGKDGDELAVAMANKLHKMNRQKSETGAYNQKDVDQFKKTYGRWTQGTIAGNSELPKAKSEWEDFKQGFANTGEEIARGDSYKAIALRIAVSLLTGSFVARGVMTGLC